MESLKNKFIVGQQYIKRKLGTTQATVDEEYNILYLRYEQQEKVAANFAKHAAQLIENFHAMSSTLHFLAEDCRDIYQNTSSEEHIKKFMNTVQDIEKKCVLPYQEKTQPAVVDAAKQYQSQFVPLKELNNKRKNQLLQFEYHRDQVQALTEKPSKDPQALPKAKEKLTKAKEEFEQMDAASKNAYSEIVDKRVETYDPALSAFIDNFIGFYNDMGKIVQDLKAAKPALTSVNSIRSNQSSGGYDTVHYPEVTSTMTQQPVVSSKPAAPLPSKPAMSAPAALPMPPEYEGEWFFLDEKVQQQGPFTYAQVKQKFKSGAITLETHIFGADFPDWKQIKSDNKLKTHLSS